VNVSPEWLNTLRDAMQDSSVALVGGPVAPRWEPTVPAWVRRAREAYPRLGAPIALLDYGPQPCDLGLRTFLGANMCVRRNVFDAVGGFPRHLGKLRGTLLSGEDHELCQRVRRAGHRALYLPDALVYHWVPTDRARVGYFLNWFFWSGITHAIMDRDNGVRNRTILGIPRYLVGQFAQACTGIVASVVTGRRAAALDHGVAIAFATGYAAVRWKMVANAAEPVTATGTSS
jgi:hypothetical protein